jgi:hypothetical protein
MKYQFVPCTLIVFVVLTSLAQAVPLMPGDAFATGPEFRAGDAVGTQIDLAESAFVGAGAFAGTLSARVYVDHPDNPLGGLTFIYAVTNDAANPNSIGRASFSGFGLSEVDVQYLPSRLVSPGYISRDPNGDVIGFNFVPQPAEWTAGFLRPRRTAVLLMHTAATRYAPTGTASFIDGGAASVPTFAPVPEPSTFASLGFGALILASIRRRLV